MIGTDAGPWSRDGESPLRGSRLVGHVEPCHESLSGASCKIDDPGGAGGELDDRERNDPAAP